MMSEMQLERKKLKFMGFTFFYDNQEAFEQQLDEIFSKKEYDFQSDTQSPFIIDAGANIGTATLFFKSIFPQAKILCFEPDPGSFATLSKNIRINQLQDVEIINMALYKYNGEIDFFGQIGVENPDTQGNSILSTWGLQRAITNTIKVKATKLSLYVNQPVDLLKLDVEGAEEIVLQELGDKLSLIKKIVIQFHQTDHIKPVNDMERITELLENHHFRYSVKKQNTNGIWPEEIKDWVKKENPSLYTIHAANEELYR